MAATNTTHTTNTSGATDASQAAQASRGSVAPASDVQGGVFSRELSPGERWYWIIDQLSTLNVCARVRIEGDVDAGALRDALGVLQQRHPRLRTAITEPEDGGPGGGPRFAPTGRPIPLREVHLSDLQPDRWAEEIDTREFTEPIDWRQGPLARAVLISHPGRVHDLLLTVPHVIADGTTALSLLRQWVRLAQDTAPPGPGRGPGRGPDLDLDGVGEGFEPFEALFPEPFRPLPPSEQADAGGQDSEGAAADGGGQDSGGGETQGGAVAGRLTPETFVPFAQRRTRMLHRSLSSEDLQRLTLACKREGATLHGVLAAALACAVARDAGAVPGEPFAVGSPLSLRDELARPVGLDEAGCFVSALHSVVAQDPGDLWTMARFIKDDLATRKKLGEQYGVFHLLAAQGPAGTADSEPFIRYFEEHGPFNFFVSNIGRFDFPDTAGTWRLSQAQFVGGISVVGYLGSSVTTSQGQLSWNFTYIDHAVSAQRAERIADDTLALVHAATNP
ncbi:condensation domain-containing protein [Streptomyces sp. NPDC056144]|uniref:condensation domain-containing protein n=1 Tax=unclassified Streptomyces TaxID=2593676 RepID=UPI0035DE0D8D